MALGNGRNTVIQNLVEENQQLSRRVAHLEQSVAVRRATRTSYMWAHRLPLLILLARRDILAAALEDFGWGLARQVQVCPMTYRAGRLNLTFHLTGSLAWGRLPDDDDDRILELRVIRCLAEVVIEGAPMTPDTFMRRVETTHQLPTGSPQRAPNAPSR